MASKIKSTKITTYQKLYCPCCRKSVHHTDYLSLSTWGPDMYKCKQCGTVFETTINVDNTITYNIIKEGIPKEYCIDCPAIKLSKNQRGKVFGVCGEFDFSIRPFRIACKMIIKNNNGGSK